MDHSYPGDGQVIQVMENELASSILLTDGKTAEALNLMKAAVAIEDKTPYEFGPPSPPKPAHELLGEMLLNLGQPQLARVQFELALLRAPKRALSVLGLARSFTQSGNRNAARETYTDLRRMWSRADPALLAVVDRSLSELQGAPKAKRAP
jgi:predicted Zn-dependent protease